MLPDFQLFDFPSHFQELLIPTLGACRSLKKLSLEASALTKDRIDLRLLADDDEKIQSLPPTDFGGFQLGYNQAVQRRNKAVLGHLRAMEQCANSFLSKVRSWTSLIERHPVPKVYQLAADHCYEQFKVRRDHFVGNLSAIREQEQGDGPVPDPHVVGNNANLEEGDRPVTDVPNAVGPNATREQGDEVSVSVPDPPNVVGTHATRELGDEVSVPVPDPPNVFGTHATRELGDEVSVPVPDPPNIVGTHATKEQADEVSGPPPNVQRGDSKVVNWSPRVFYS